MQNPLDEPQEEKKGIDYVALEGVLGLTLLGIGGLYVGHEYTTVAAVTGIAALVTRIYK